MKKQKYWVWLNSLTRISPAKRKQLLDFYGDPETIWNAKPKDYQKIPFMTAVIYQQLTDLKIRDNVGMYCERISKQNISLVTIADKSYPQYLKNIYDPPIVLFVKGNLDICGNYIAVVGSRKATPYGLSMAKRISYELSSKGFNIVSGLARGIDTCSHKAAMESGGNTTAVLGCGLDIAYPPENKRLMEEIAQKGAVISEFLPGTKPFKYNFPTRNRIISGLSMGVVVIEAGEKSGSLITASLALEQGREVFAVPGNINSRKSCGTNSLIKDGAKLVMGIDDIVEELSSLYNSEFADSRVSCEKDKKPVNVSGLDIEERRILEELLTEPLNIDMISRRSGMNINAVNSVLVMLELKGFVEQFPGRLYVAKKNF